MEEVISIKNVSKSYGLVKAVDNLSLSVNKGEFFGFLGPNGAGKTTTIRMITGIIKPDIGKIKVARLSCGVVPESRGFYDWMTGEEYLSFFAGLYSMPKSAAQDKVKNLLEMVDLAKNKNKKVGSYSRGMKQRLGLARALINDPKILLLDEPTLGLDPQGQEDIKNLLKNLNSTRATIFYSSHLLLEIENLCSRVAIINQGKLIAQGTISELKTNTQSKTLIDAFLSLTKANHD
jgi:ABC-2 type transport system ATP-binding protein